MDNRHGQVHEGTRALTTLMGSQIPILAMKEEPKVFVL